ncbi:MAG: DNA translocase FtsK [Chitinispirillales bacterium]|jgi:S-DNA-T family DNA segregation ATPase FtsK/SpoIIIE|nr:DNA translocase FtsK [Chitinispirillales bacterium]
MARKKTVKASESSVAGKGAAVRADAVILHGIWGLIYLAVAVLLLVSMLFYSHRQLGAGAETHILGPYLGTGMALGMFFLFGRTAAFIFAAAVGYIGTAKLANRRLHLKMLLWLAALSLELCVLLAVRHMPLISANGLMAAANAVGVDAGFAGMLVVSALVPLFKGRVFGPYFIVSVAMAITLMVGLRVRTQSVVAAISKWFAAAAAWIKKALAEVMAGIKNSPGIRPETSQQNVAGDAGKASNEKPSPKKNGNAASPGQTAARQAAIPVPPPPEEGVAPPSGSNGVDAGEDQRKELSPEEEARKRLEEELSEFRKKKRDPIKILNVETPDVDPQADDDGGIIPIFPEEGGGGSEESPGGKRGSGKLAEGESEEGGDSEFAVTEPKEPARPYVVPSPDIIPDPPPPADAVDQEAFYRNSETLLKTLNNFGVEGKVNCVSPGPIVTRYEIELAPGVKVSKVVNLHDDISMAVGGQKIRIQAPIPGKSAIGIELPNPTRQTVYFKQILLSDAFKKSTADIPVVIGTNISGAAYITDIAKMPHVLIAGQTGAGKSVCINSLVCSMLMTKKPEELRLIMIDPKKVELACYADIPHLLAPVVTEPKEAVKALQWGVQEMERRYRMLAKVGAKKLETFNERVEAGKLDGVLDEEDNKKLPFIVIIVDELADLMMTASKDVEAQIQRIAQLARAVGIHLIVATQRPSVDIITGKIKANLASRIAFRTIQSVDSKTILGYVGAEKLLGMGDMLFLRNGATDIERFHGSFISEEDVETIVADIRAQQVKVDKIDSFHDVIGDEESGDEGDDGGGGDGKRDSLFAEAAQIVVSVGQGSTSLLQRRMNIGFARAGRLMDQLERAGVVGPSKGSKVREVLMSQVDLADII